MIYAILQKVFHVIAELPSWGTAQVNKFFPSAVVASEITPEYLGVEIILLVHALQESWLQVELWHLS